MPEYWAKLRRYITNEKRAYVKKGLIAFSAIQMTVILSLISLWFLSTDITIRVAVNLAGLKIVDFIPIFLSGVIWLFVLGNDIRSNKPAFVVAGTMTMIVIIDLVCILLFAFSYKGCKIYHSCVDKLANPNGCETTDPLCSFDKFDVFVAIYLLVSIISFIVNIFYGIIMTLVLIELAHMGQNSKPSNTPVVRSGIKRETKVDKDRLFQLGINAAMVIWVILSIQFWIITPSSTIKFTLLCSLGHIYSFIQVITSYSIKKENFRSIFAEVAAIILNIVGIVVCFLYYTWLCKEDSVGKSIGPIETCDVGKYGSMYLLGLQIIMTTLGLARVMIQNKTWRNQPGLHVQMGESEREGLLYDDSLASGNTDSEDEEMKPSQSMMPSNHRNSEMMHSEASFHQRSPARYYSVTGDGKMLVKGKDGKLIVL